MKNDLNYELEKVRDEMTRAEGSDLAYLRGWEMALLWMIGHAENGYV